LGLQRFVRVDVLGCEFRSLALARDAIPPVFCAKSVEGEEKRRDSILGDAEKCKKVKNRAFF
jgi:hypothetical protein